MSVCRLLVSIAAFAVLTTLVGCGAAKNKPFSKASLLSVFQKKGTKSTDAEDTVAGDATAKTEPPTQTTKISLSEKPIAGGSENPTPDPAEIADAGEADDAGENFNFSNDRREDPTLPLIVKPRQPSVEVTPPTNTAAPDPVPLEPDDGSEGGGLKPRKPKLDIVLPGGD